MTIALADRNTATSAAPAGPQPVLTDAQAAILDYAERLGEIGTRPPIVNGRYDLPHPVTGKPAKWTRSSTFAKTLDDTYNLDRWQKRMLIEGLVAHPVLLEQITAITDRGAKEGKARLHQLIDQAHHAAGGNVNRDVGTAMHTITEHADRGAALELGPWSPAVAAYRQAAERHGITFPVGGIEPVVVNLTHQVAGRPDRFAQVPARPHPVTFDLKTGSGTHPISWAVQLAEYANAEWIWTPDGYIEMPPVDREVGIICHMDVDAGTVVLHWLDLTEGWRRACVAKEARTARNGENKLLIQVAPPAAIEPNTGPQAVVMDEAAPLAEALAAADADDAPRREALLAMATGGHITTVPEIAADTGSCEVAIPAPVDDTPAPTERTDWIIGRLRVFAGHPPARAWLEAIWPTHIPPAPPWTNTQVDTIGHLLDEAERATDAPFPPLDPTQPTPGEQLLADRQAADTEAPVHPSNWDVPDDGQPMTDEQTAKVAATAAGWDQGRLDLAIAWGGEGKRGGRPWNVGPDRRTLRIGHILLAAGAAITHLYDEDEPETLTRHALELVLGIDLQPAWKTGSILGSLTVDQAIELTNIAEAYGASDKDVVAELGRRVIAAPAA